MTFEHLLVDTPQDGIGTITLNRPAVLNAMSFDLVRELMDAIEAFAKKPEIHVLVITGAGEKAFSAGGDIHEMSKTPPEELAARRDFIMAAMWNLAQCRLPIIGALNGLAHGGGALLATAFDIRIGCARSQFRFPGARYGQLNATWSLPMIVGWARAKELIYTTRPIEADEATQMGLLNKLVAPEEVMNTALEMARQIAKNPPEQVQDAKELFGRFQDWQWMYHAEVDAKTRHHQISVAEGFSEFFARKEPQ